MVCDISTDLSNPPWFIKPLLFVFELIGGSIDGKQTKRKKVKNEFY